MKFRLLFIFLLSAASLFAQDPTFTAQLSADNISVGQRITLSFQLENGSGRIQAPRLHKDLQIIYGPSQSQSYANYNGVASISVSLKYVFTPLSEGTYTIPSAKVEVNGKVLTTTPIEFTVSKAGTNSTSTPSTNNTVKTDKDGNFLLLVTSNKNSVYVNEPFTLTYTIYSRYNRLQPNEVDLPAPSNFWLENIELKERSWDRELAVINGKQYRKIIMAQRVLYPQKAGRLSTGVSEIKAVVNGGFFSAGQQVSAKSDEFFINVKELPKNSAANFSGFTGRLSCSVLTNKDTVNANEAISYTLRLKGEGNFKLLNPPKINFPEDFEVFEPKVKNAYNLTYSGYKGYIEIEYLLIPRFSGEYEIPSTSISYFDTDAKRYVECEFDRKKVFVIGGTKKNNANSNLSGGSDRIAVDNLNSDIRYMDESEAKNIQDTLLAENSTAIWGARVGLIFMFVLGLFVIKRKEALTSDVVAYKSSKAAKNALKQLKLIRKETNENYNGIYKAYTSYLSEKFGIEMSQMTKATIQNTLSKASVKSDKIESVHNIIQRCEMASYAPNASSGYSGLLDAAEKSIKELA